MMVFLLLLALVSSDIAKLQQADNAYKEGNYEVAANLYREAFNADPSDFVTAFNLGNALFQLGRHEEAEKTWAHARSLAKKATDGANTFYNQSLAAFKQNQLDKALAAARNSVKMNPQDEDARANVEIISRILDKVKQEQNQQNQDQDQKQDQQKKEDENDQNQQDQKEQDQNQQQDQQQQDQQDQQTPRQSQIPKEQAERLLDALKNKEKEALLKKKDMQRIQKRRKAEKDW